MVWIIGAICMIFFGAGLMAIGLSLSMLGYGIGGESWSSLVFFCWCPFGDPGETCRLSVRIRRPR